MHGIDSNARKKRKFNVLNQFNFGTFLLLLLLGVWPCGVESHRHGVSAFTPSLPSHLDSVRRRQHQRHEFTREILPVGRQSRDYINPVKASQLCASTTGDEADTFLEKPLLRFKFGDKEKVVSAFGLWVMIVALITCPVWLVAMKAIEGTYAMFPDFDPHREIFDASGKVWSKAFLSMSMSYPEITGERHLLEKSESKERGACLYVANHASWLDIPILCTVLDSVFKFIAKGELEKIPCIGHQLIGGDHILIDREDRRSQLRTFRSSMNWLRNGVPIMAFPEGSRSKDGRLMDFKGGSFSLAMKSKIPIVPITIRNAHAVMPSHALVPLRHGAGRLSLHVHSPIDVEGLTEEELSKKVRSAIASKLPPDQQPLPEPLTASETEKEKELQLV